MGTTTFALVLQNILIFETNDKSKMMNVADVNNGWLNNQEGRVRLTHVSEDGRNFDEKIFHHWAVVVAQLVERSLPNSRGPQFESSHRQNLY